MKPRSGVNQTMADLTAQILGDGTDPVRITPRVRGSGAIGAPTELAQFSVGYQELERKVKELEDQAGGPVRLDPALIRRSRWANRHELAFHSQAFADLRDDIRSAGGNVQPIKVRLVVPSEGEMPQEGAPRFEIVFGHRRHAACLELGLPVLAVIVSTMNDQELFAEMDRENRAREDLSPYEQGLMYVRALDAGLFPSMRQLAMALGVDSGNMSRAIAVAQLSAAVVEAFPSPLEIQTRWGAALKDLAERDGEGLNRRAEAIKARGTVSSAKAVFDELLNEPGPEATQANTQRISGRHGAASLKVDGRGRLVVTFEGAVSPTLHGAVEAALKKVLG